MKFVKTDFAAPINNGCSYVVYITKTAEEAMGIIHNMAMTLMGMHAGEWHYHVSKEQRMQLRASLDAEAIRRMNDWNKKMGRLVGRLIRFGLAQAAASTLAEAKDARWHDQLRELSEHHDKVFYNRNGESVAMYDWKEDKFYDYEPGEC